MATYKQLMDIANDAMFQKRIKYCMQKAATDVMAELNTVTAHTQRVAYAKTILAGTASIYEYAVAFLQNGTIAGEANPELFTDGAFGIPDSDFQFTINSYFNAMAGVAN